MSPLRPIAAALLAATLLAVTGCGEPSLDSPEYGEIIYEVPPRLNQPYPLPELDAPASTAAPGPQTSGDKAVAAEPSPK